MSFDLKIVNNDLAIGSDGTLQTVINNEKLQQDVLKAILTPLGSNRFFKWYGSLLSNRVIGQNLPFASMEIEIKRSIEETLNNLMALQKSQAFSQYVSAGEMIAGIGSIDVVRNEEDPRQFDIYINILTRQLTPIEVAFTVRI
jgi:hypothetical protein